MGCELCFCCLAIYNNICMEIYNENVTCYKFHIYYYYAAQSNTHTFNFSHIDLALRGKSISPVLLLVLIPPAEGNDGTVLLLNIIMASFGGSVQATTPNITRIPANTCTCPFSCIARETVSELVNLI
jgi:hypothetical protein